MHVHTGLYTDAAPARHLDVAPEHRPCSRPNFASATPDMSQDLHNSLPAVPILPVPALREVTRPGEISPAWGTDTASCSLSSSQLPQDVGACMIWSVPAHLPHVAVQKPTLSQPASNEADDGQRRDPLAVD
jgi:hypothetical protein